jgi:hypothetical protein
MCHRVRSPCKRSRGGFRPAVPADTLRWSLVFEAARNKAVAPYSLLLFGGVNFGGQEGDQGHGMLAQIAGDLGIVSQRRDGARRRQEVPLLGAHLGIKRQCHCST